MPDIRPALYALLGDKPTQWTDADVDRLAEIVDAYQAGDLILDRHGRFLVSPKVIENLPKLDFRMKARQVAESIGRPTPKKFDAAVADVVLYAAVRAA